METTNLQLTPEMREVLLANPGLPVYIADRETRKVYLLVEQGAIPELEEEYNRAALEMAREQIARGQIASSSIGEVINRARLVPLEKS